MKHNTNGSFLWNVYGIFKIHGLFTKWSNDERHFIWSFTEVHQERRRLAEKVAARQAADDEADGRPLVGAFKKYLKKTLVWKKEHLVLISAYTICTDFIGSKIFSIYVLCFKFVFNDVHQDNVFHRQIVHVLKSLYMFLTVC